MGDTPSSSGHRYRWLQWFGGAVLLAGAIFTAALVVAARHMEPLLRAEIVLALEQHFHTKVELDQFHVSVRHGTEAEWGIWAKGAGLRIWPPHHASADPALEVAVEAVPLIKLDQFSFHVPLHYGRTQNLHIPELRLKGLSIHIPPRSQRDKASGIDSAVAGQAVPKTEKAPGPFAGITIGQIESDDAELVLETDKPGKLPLRFDIQRLLLKNVHPGAPMTFEATLTNPKPKGLIHTSGTLGPLDLTDLGESPLEGTYHFEHADLATFKGLGGMLESTGDYQGTLRELSVKGTADVPDFQLTHFGNTMPLRTQFDAMVDGTDGDTRLERVEATLGHSHFTTKGQIVRVKLPVEGAKPSPAASSAGPAPASGHIIDLRVDIPHGAIQDFLRLTSRASEPIMTGDIAADANLHIPPGPQPVHLRLKLDGHFQLDNVRFTSDKVQKRVEELSLRGQGHPQELRTASPDAIIRSHMEGTFHVAKGVVTLPDLQYEVPGAEVHLQGSYALDGDLHMDGVARMQATVSKMVGGWKGLLLKPADRLFKKDGAGAEIPIKLRGTRKSPDFGIDIGRIGHTSPETPGQKQ